MRIYNGIIMTVASILLLAGCCNCAYTIKVSNPTTSDRLTELVEMKADSIIAVLDLAEGDSFVIRSAGKEVPYQITYDGKLVFPVTLKASQSQTFRFSKGIPSAVTVQVCGKHYPERVDDICWENDLVGFRVYGFKEDNPSGYDIFTKKNSDLPVIPEMYRKALDPEKQELERQIRKEHGKDSAARFRNQRSFHIDHGYGADFYAVGPTLGAGTSALLNGEDIIYPFCYDKYEILDNGPLRFTLRLTFRPFQVGNCAEVVETRIMSIDLGSHFTRTSVSFEGLDCAQPIVTGIVVQDTEGKAVGNAEKGYIAYPSPTQNFDKFNEIDNGRVFIGHVYPSALDDTGLKYFSDEESNNRGGAKGHMLAHSEYVPQSEFVYYWGFGWNYADVETYEEWIEHLEIFSAQLRNPLTITY